MKAELLALLKEFQQRDDFARYVCDFVYQDADRDTWLLCGQLVRAWCQDYAERALVTLNTKGKRFRTFPINELVATMANVSHNHDHFSVVRGNDPRVVTLRKQLVADVIQKLEKEDWT